MKATLYDALGILPTSSDEEQVLLDEYKADAADGRQ